MKTTLALLCALVLAVCPALADSYTIPGTNITLVYEVSGNPATATITDCNGNADGDGQTEVVVVSLPFDGSAPKYVVLEVAE